MFDYTRTMHIVLENGKKEAQERIDNVNSSLASFTNYYTLNKIFLPKHLCAKIDNIIKEYYNKGWDFADTQRSSNAKTSSLESLKAEVAKAKSISNSIENEMPPLIEELESEFRLILVVYQLS